MAPVHDATTHSLCDTRSELVGEYFGRMRESHFNPGTFSIGLTKKDDMLYTKECRKLVIVP